MESPSYITERLYGIEKAEDLEEELSRKAIDGRARVE